MVGAALELVRYHGVEAELHGERRGTGRERDPVRHPEYMGVDRDDGLVPDGVEHDVRGLAPHTRQRFQELACAGYDATVLAYQQVAERHHVLGLAVVESDRLDEALQALSASIAWGVAAMAKSGPAALLTLTSVACAESATATRSVKGSA